jgi:cbb3-type cytochrome oxidase subunit 3
MTDGEVLYLIGVIALFAVFIAVLAYSQITSGGPKR